MSDEHLCGVCFQASWKHRDPGNLSPRCCHGCPCGVTFPDPGNGPKEDEFAKDQPKDGDTILHCGHVPDSRSHVHWFKFDVPIQFVRPDGTRGEAVWFAACEPCFIKHGEKVAHFGRGDCRWTGVAPAIEKVEN